MPVERLHTGSQIDAFIRFSWEVYRGNRIWVPPVIQDDRKFLSGKGHFFKHCQYRIYAAREGSKIAARMAAFYDRNLVQHWGKKIGVIGFFEALPGKEVQVRELFEAAETFLREQGAEIVLGPINGDIARTCGLLANAYNQPPVFLMAYNPAYYHAYFRRCGYAPSKELLAYTADLFDDRLKRRVSYLLKRAQKAKVRIRAFDPKRFDEESLALYRIYSETFNQHWGFASPSREEMIYDLWNPLRPLIDPDLVLFAEYEGKIVGFSIAIPDYNPIFKKINGNLDFLGGVTLLRSRRNIHEGRLFAIGVSEHLRGQKISPLLVAFTYAAMMRKGYTKCEYSWVVHENFSSRNVVKKFKNDAYRHYYVYEKHLSRNDASRLAE